MSAFSVVIDKLIHPLKKPAIMEDSSSDGEPPFSFYPPLYVTPTVEPTRPSSPSPSSPSSSPYVVNFKRRGPLQSVSMQKHAGEDGIESQRKPIHGSPPSGYDASMETCEDASKMEIELEMAEDNAHSEEADLEPEISKLSEAVVAQRTKTNPQLTLTTSTMGLNSDRFISPRASTCEEFYDAPEAPLDDSLSEAAASSASLTLQRMGRSAEELLPCLQEEIARRMRAEDALALLQQRWHDAAQKCASMGISMPASEDSLADMRNGASLHGVNEHFIGRLAVARLVAGAVASAGVRAAKDEELDGLIASKNWEISRLRDKLHYVELVNLEMSQRNQEIMEITQRRKRRHKRRQKWVFGCFGSAICLGTAGLLCYKLIPWDEPGTWSKSVKNSAQH